MCITAPLDGVTLTGEQTVTGTVSVTGTNPGIAKTIFFLRGAYLITDITSPYTFVLPTNRFVDGAAVLEMEADMKDGFPSVHASITPIFNNGVTTPPVNTGTFTPRTPTPATGQPLVVAAAGDGASGETYSTSATDLIAGWNPDMVLYLGDVYEKGSSTEFRNWYGDNSSYYGRFRSKTNPVVGNHEYEGLTAPGYFDYWDNIPHYYSYNAGGWHFIALDSTSQFNQTDPTSAQFQWLQSDLAANVQPCTLAYFHHPVHTVGPQGDATRMNSIWSLLNTWGVDLVLNGHDHDYQRWVPLDGSGNPSPNGITEFVVGTGGHGIQAFTTSDSRMAVGLDTSPAGFGALKLQLSAGSATYQFVSTTLGVKDSGSISCAPASPDNTPPTAPTNLTATPLGSSRVDLAWSAATDNTGVVGYDISRGGTFLTSVSGSTLSFADNSVAASTTYSYTVKARDLASNSSAASTPASATTGSGSSVPIFTDDFESGALTGWTNAGMTVQAQEVYAGTWAARGTTTTAAAWAWHSLSTAQTDDYYRIRFKIVSQGANNMYLLKERTGTGTSIVGLYLGDTGNTLNYRNDAAAITVRSPRTAAVGVWHEVQVHLVINGTSGQIETWLDGSKVTELSRTDNFGTTPIGRVQIGDNSGTRAYDLAIDDLVVGTQFISSAPPADTSPPSAPSNLNAVPFSSSRIDLGWSPSFDTVGVVAYDIFRDGDVLDSVIGSSTSYSDTTADAGTTYVYTVKARDLAGNLSNASSPASATAPAIAPGAPTVLTATSGNTQVTLTWTAPVSNGGSAITNYRIYRSTTSGTETLLTTIGNLTTFTNTGLTNGTTYFYKVAAVNAAGTGAQTGEASATPAATTTVPGAPTGLGATPADSQVTLVWAAPVSNGGSAITNYNVYRSTTSGGETLLTTLGNVTMYTDTGLSNGTAYFYKVAAVNAVGEGALSGEAAATPAIAPDPPTGLGAVASSGQVALSWTAPASNGGSAITGYKVYRGTSTGSETLLASPLGVGTTYTDAAATNGTTWFYKVAAANAVGTGAQSAETSATPTGAPGAPTGLGATPADSQVTLAWNAPASDGGSAITTYNVYRGTTSGGEILVASPGTTTSYVDPGLGNGTTYYYKVTASSLIGEGAPSGEVSATPAIAPDAPTGLTASAGDTQVTLSWTAPASNGGSSITGYRIYRSTTTDTETFLATTIGPVVSYTNTGLTNGTTYFYKVTAVNGVGEGGLSGEASATPVTVPGAPTGLGAMAGNAQVTLSWTAPASTGGSAITGYKVYRSATTGTEVFLIAPAGTGTSYTDTGLSNGTTYFYKVTAVNVVGESGLSGEASATPAIAPDAPTGLGASAGNTQVILSWTAPASNGGSAISAYKIYRSTTSGTETLFTTLGNVTSYTNTGLTNGTAYFYKVSAVNTVGEGAQSAEASATPVAPPLLLGEGFESGLVGWTTAGPIAIDSTLPHSGTKDARIQCGGSACWGYRPFSSGQTASDLYVQAWVYVSAIDNQSTNLFKLRTGSGGSGTAVFGFTLNNKGRLSYRDDAASKTVTGTHVVTTGVWHRITAHFIVGTSGHVDVWLDGALVSELSRTDNFGTTAIGKMQIGDNASGGSFDVRLDDLTASVSVIAP